MRVREADPGESRDGCANTINNYYSSDILNKYTAVQYILSKTCTELYNCFVLHSAFCDVIRTDKLYSWHDILLQRVRSKRLISVGRWCIKIMENRTLKFNTLRCYAQIEYYNHKHFHGL